MGARINWVIVGSAIAAALALVGFSAWAAQSGIGAQQPPILIASADLMAERPNWQDALGAIAPTPTSTDPADYRAPAELSLTDRISRELFVTYLGSRRDGTATDSEIAAGVRQVLERNISPIAPETEYTPLDVQTGTVTLEAYADALGAALAKAGNVQEYELLTFSRALGTGDINGIPELAAAASTYASIEQDLLRMRVPSELAAEHLELLKSIAALAHVNKLFSRWSGDPVDALAYIDAFNKAERASQKAVSALFSKISRLAR